MVTAKGLLPRANIIPWTINHLSIKWVQLYNYTYISVIWCLLNEALDMFAPLSACYVVGSQWPHDPNAYICVADALDRNRKTVTFWWYKVKQRRGINDVCLIPTDTMSAYVSGIISLTFFFSFNVLRVSSRCQNHDATLCWLISLTSVWYSTKLVKLLAVMDDRSCLEAPKKMLANTSCVWDCIAPLLNRRRSWWGLFFVSQCKAFLTWFAL